LTEFVFYHLERSPLETALPGLLARSLERGWRVVLQVGSDERLEALNAHLWAYDDASFLPHGSSADGNSADQPIWLTTGDDNPNQAAVRFLVDGAEPAEFSGYERIVLMFDAADEQGLATARIAWKKVRELGLDATYWRQDENGRWAKQGDR
jgi:DNA polymerase-3 subunit chi